MSFLSHLASSNVTRPLTGCLTLAGGAEYLLLKELQAPLTPPSTRTGMSSSTSAEDEGDEMASSCPSNWLKEGSLSPFPTDTTRRCPSEAGGEGRTLRGFGAANGALGAGVDGASRGPGVAGVDSDSDSWAAETAAADAAAFAAW